MRIIIYLFALVFASERLSATNPLDLIQRGQEKMYNLEFAGADKLFDSLITLNPGHPAGYFFKGSSYFYQMISGHNTHMKVEEFLRWNDTTIAISEKFREEKDHEVEADYYRGLAFGNNARYYAVNGDFVKAFYYAKRSQSLHKDIIDKNADYYDAYLSVGMYNYYAAAAPRFFDLIGSLFGLSGDRALGIQQLEKAYAYGKMTKLEAQFFLANVYLEEGNYETSLRFYSNLTDRFPGNPYLYNQAGMVSFFFENYSVAENLFQQSLLQSKEATRSADMFALYFLGRMDRLHNDYPKAISEFRRAVEIGQKQTLYKMIDGWVVGAAAYQAGECLEISGKRAEAVAWYERARDHSESAKGIIQGAKNRIEYPLVPFEIGFIKQRYQVLIDPTLSNVAELRLMATEAELKPELKKYVSQIYYFLGRAKVREAAYLEAHDFFEKCLTTQISDGDHKWREPHAMYYLAFCDVKLGYADAAKVLLKKALDFDGYSESNRIRFLANRLLKEI